MRGVNALAIRHSPTGRLSACSRWVLPRGETSPARSSEARPPLPDNHCVRAGDVGRDVQLHSAAVRSKIRARRTCVPYFRSTFTLTPHLSELFMVAFPVRSRRFFLLIRIVLALTLIVALAAGCAKRESGLFYSDPAQPIQVESGQAFVIALPSEQADTHAWQLAQEIDPALLQLTAARQTQLHYVNTPDAERGQEFWIFMPTSPGTTAIALNYVTPSGDVAEGVVFEVEIR